MSYAEPVFSSGEIGLALVVAFSVQVSFFALLYTAGQSTAAVRAQEEVRRQAIPIAVKPVLDELPLLKLGGKKVRPKLPDMWKKQAPVQRFEEKSAPSSVAKKTPEAIPTSKVAELDASAPPPDAEVAKEVDQELLDAAPDAEPTVEGEGSPDGVEEGTEVDPLKARAASQYLAKILGWFNVRFHPPSGEIPCEELHGLSAGVAVRVGPDRSVVGYTVSSPSGNGIFDAKVRATMDSIIGQELPPPPPLYPDILESTVFPRLSGAKATCE